MCKFHTTYGCFKSLLDLQERLHEASDASNDNDQVLSKDVKFSMTGKIRKAREEYQNPTSLSFHWSSFLGDEGRSWRHCGGESVLTNDKFTLTDNVTLALFDKMIPPLKSQVRSTRNGLQPVNLAPDYAKYFGIPAEKIKQLENMKMAIGFIVGQYGQEVNSECQFDLDEGPNGEGALTAQYAIFYRNGTFPTINCGASRERTKCLRSKDRYFEKFPQGFSCGKAVYVDWQTEGFDYFTPVDCSEVEILVANPKSCQHNPELGDDCMNFPNFT